MFPGKRFSNPVFIQYGQNDTAHAHGSERYIYAVSSDGPWSHADHLILGRVRRTKIGALNAADWEFYQGRGRDGMVDREWTRDASRARPILSDPDNLGWTNVMYVPQAGRYLMGQWHWLKGRWHEGDCTWVLREAPTPWGPWTTVTTKVWDMYHDYYFPVFAPKFINADGLRLYVFTAGWGKYLSPLYRLTVIPLYLRTASDSSAEPASTRSAALEDKSQPHERSQAGQHQTRSGLSILCGSKVRFRRRKWSILDSRQNKRCTRQDGRLCSASTAVHPK